MTAEQRMTTILAAVGSQADALVDALNTLFATDVFTGGEESGAFVVRQPLDYLCEDIFVRFSSYYYGPYGTVTEILAIHFLQVEPETVVNLTATLDGTEYQLTATETLSA
jgi:hypothetical protein